MDAVLRHDDFKVSVMNEVKIGKHKVELYDDINQLSVKRYHAFNRMLLVDAGIGSDIADFDRHIERVRAYDKKEQKDNLLAELQNLRQSVYFILNGINPKMMAFAALVTKIDGSACDDLSDDGLRKVVERINDAPYSEVTASLEAVKKKIDQDLLRYFPKLFDDATVKQYYDRLRDRTRMVLESIIDGKERRDDIDRLSDDLLTWSRPTVFSGGDNAEVRYDRQFEKICIAMSQHLNVSPKDYTVQEYFSAYEYILDMNKKKNTK